MTQFDIPAASELPIALQAAVPLYIFELYERGEYGIEPWEVEGARAFGHVLASKGDQLLFKSRKKGETARLFAGLVKALSIAAIMAPGGVPGERIRFDGLQLLSARYGEEAARTWINAQIARYQEAVSQVAQVSVTVQALANEEWLGSWDATPWLRAAREQEIRLLREAGYVLDPAYEATQAPIRTLREELARQARLFEQQATTQVMRTVATRFLALQQQGAPCLWSFDRKKTEQWLKLFRHEEVTGGAWIED